MCPLFTVVYSPRTRLRARSGGDVSLIKRSIQNLSRLRRGDFRYTTISSTHVFRLEFVRASGEAILGTQRYFNKALYTSTLTKHFTQALYPSTLSKHFIQALYTSTLTKHFIQALYQSTLSNHFTQALYQSTLSKNFIKVLQRYYNGITKVLQTSLCNLPIGVRYYEV